MKLAFSCFVVAVLLALVLGRFDVARMPQVVQGDDALSVAFGDARVVIGQAMLQKADSYFHGGIDMEPHDCEMDGAHDHEHDHDHEHEHDCDGDCDGHDHGHGDGHADEAPESAHRRFDPWRWINSHVRAPQVERHLDGEKAVELMPWFWASVRSDPHNIDAWTTAWYIANKVMKDRDLAWRVIEEGMAKNPDSLEIAFYGARHIYDAGRGDVAKAKRLFEDVRDRAISRCGGDEERLSESDRYMLMFARNYLDAIADPQRSAKPKAE